MKFFICSLICGLVFCVSALAQKKGKAAKTQFTSVYTDMKRECRTLPEPKREEMGGDPAGACKGYGGYRIFISYSAAAASLYADLPKTEDLEIPLGTDYFGYGDRGEKIEWRMANGKPFAVILRLGKYKESDDGNPFNQKDKIGETLVVKGLKGFEQIDFEIDARQASANEKARALADENFKKK